MVEERAEEVLCPTAKPAFSTLHITVSHEIHSVCATRNDGTVTAINIGVVNAFPRCAEIVRDRFFAGITERRVFAHECNENTGFCLYDGCFTKLIAFIGSNDDFRPRFAFVIAVISALLKLFRFGISFMDGEHMSAVGKHSVFIGNDTFAGNHFRSRPGFSVIMRTENMLFAVHKIIFLLRAVQFIADDDQFTVFHAGNTGTVIGVCGISSFRQRLFFTPRFTVIQTFFQNESGIIQICMVCAFAEYADQLSAFGFGDVGKAFVYAVIAGNRILLDHGKFLHI